MYLFTRKCWFEKQEVCWTLLLCCCDPKFQQFSHNNTHYSVNVHLSKTALPFHYGHNFKNIGSKWLFFCNYVFLTICWKIQNVSENLINSLNKYYQTPEKVKYIYRLLNIILLHKPVIKYAAFWMYSTKLVFLVDKNY